MPSWCLILPTLPKLRESIARVTGSSGLKPNHTKFGRMRNLDEDLVRQGGPNWHEQPSEWPSWQRAGVTGIHIRSWSSCQASPQARWVLVRWSLALKSSWALMRKAVPLKMILNKPLAMGSPLATWPPLSLLQTFLSFKKSTMSLEQA